MVNWWINRLIDGAMLWNRWHVRRPLLQAAVNPRATQTELLLRILQKNAETEIGRQYDFCSIQSLEEYQQRVPVHDYDTLAPYIERQIDGPKALTALPPEYYARTSGTTGRYKDIPLTQNGLQQVGLAQKQLAVSLWQDTDFFQGKVLGFAGKAEEGELKNGCSYGSVSGTTYKSLSPVLAAKFAVPAEALSLEDIESRYQVFALTVLGCDQLTGVVTANPSSMLKLVRLINDHAAELLGELNGVMSEWLTDDARTLLPEVLSRSNVRHIETLGKLLISQKRLSARQIFPSLSTIACWTGGSCGTAIRQLQAGLPDAVRFVEYGYGSSEFMGSVNVDALNNLCLPQLKEHVYEFVLRADWEADRQLFVSPQDLLSGHDYYVFVTTKSGLYRYNINDVVRAGEPVGHCPTIRFLQKGKGVTNITGEKLSEYQLIEAVECCLSVMSLQTGGYVALANETDSRYHLYIENLRADRIRDLEHAVDCKLRELNGEYDDKRASDRLHALKVLQLTDGACDQIKQWSLDKGVREVQYKPVVLDYGKAWQTKLTPLLKAENDV